MAVADTDAKTAVEHDEVLVFPGVLVYRRGVSEIGSLLGEPELTAGLLPRGLELHQGAEVPDGSLAWDRAEGG
jgi:hypothetical protein